MPLAVYRAPSGKVNYVTDAKVTYILCSPASEVYKLDPKEAKDRENLQRWSSHSLCVGTCILLHAMGFSDTQIMFFLRWCSDAFKVYLRNLFVMLAWITVLKTFSMSLSWKPLIPFSIFCVSYQCATVNELSPSTEARLLVQNKDNKKKPLPERVVALPKKLNQKPCVNNCLENLQYVTVLKATNSVFNILCQLSMRDCQWVIPVNRVQTARPK